MRDAAGGGDAGSGVFLALILLAFGGRMSWRRAVAMAGVFTIFIALVSWGLIAFDHWESGRWHRATRDIRGFFLIQIDPSLARSPRACCRQIAEVGRLIIPGMWKTHSREHEFLSVNNLIYVAVFIPVAVGWWKFCRETTDPLALALPFFIALYVVYPYDSGTRFTVPVLAVLAGQHLVSSEIHMRINAGVVFGSHCYSYAGGDWILADRCGDTFAIAIGAGRRSSALRRRFLHRPRSLRCGLTRRGAI